MIHNYTKYRENTKIVEPHKGYDIALIMLKEDVDSRYMPACLAPKLADYTGNTAATLYGWGFIADINFGLNSFGRNESNTWGTPEDCFYVFRDPISQTVLDAIKDFKSPVLRMTNQTIISNEECRKSTGFRYTCNLELRNLTYPNGTKILKHLAIIGARKASNENEIFEGMMCTVNEGRSECKGDSGGPLTVNENGKQILVGVVSWSTGCAKVISIIYVSRWWRFLSIPSNT